MAVPAVVSFPDHSKTCAHVRPRTAIELHPRDRCVMEVEKCGSCVVIHMRLGENRLNPDFLKAFHEALDKAESYEDATAVVTMGEGKVYSLGLDLNLMATMSLLELLQFSNDLQKLLARLLTFPLVTVAAINGHVYAAGVFIALAHDYKIMRSEKGWYRLNEIHIKRNFSVGVLEMAKALLPQKEHKMSVVLGKRYTGPEAEAAGIVDETCPLAELKDRAIAAASRLAGEGGLDRKTLSALKHDLYRDLYRILMEPLRHYSML